MTENNYRELQNLVAEYGNKTMEFSRAAKDLGKQILTAFSDHLNAGKAVAFGCATMDLIISEEADFKPGREHGEAAFSTDYENITYLEPIQMGICTVIENLKDSGSCWVYTLLEFTPVDDGVVVRVGDQTLTPTYTPEQMEGICEAILHNVREEFLKDMPDGGRKIGFY